MENKYRNVYCGNVTKEYVGKEIKLAGWVNSIRNLGGLVFITLRDETGIVQLISKEPEKYSKINNESTITVLGTVNKRTDDMVNKNMKTGEIEVAVKELTILGECKNILPFEVNSSRIASEETRLKYRYIDLRNKQNHDNIILRTNVISYIREIMNKMDFTEIQTPIITASSPEGARDFVVPSRKFKGKFYALPQAPQIFKELLMCSGFSKYFQIAPCFRDEDPRSDRLYGEFYQLDLEMSFADEEDIYKVGEKVFYDVFTKFSDKYVSPAPFRRISYKESMLKYGTDKPDLRNPLIIEDLTEILSNNEFIAFKDNIIRGIKVDKIDKSNSWYKSLEEYIKECGAKGLCYIKVETDGFKSSIDKYLSEEDKKELKDKFSLKEGNVIFIIADKKDPSKFAGMLRTKLGEELELLDKNKFEFCIINNFPMYEYNEETKGFDFTHNPFSMPQGGMESLQNKNPEEILAYQYDFVCNGLEMASGGERNYNTEMLKKAFELAGYEEKDIEEKFTSLYTAFQYGAPPHAGMAPGIDRMLMLLTNETNIREVVAFPISASGQDFLMGCPSEITEKQLREVHIKVRD